MTRRSLLGLLTTAALDPERLLWVPGRKLISIPAAPKVQPVELVVYWMTMDGRVIEVLPLDSLRNFPA